MIFIYCVRYKKKIRLIAENVVLISTFFFHLIFFLYYFKWNMFLHDGRRLNLVVRDMMATKRKLL